MTQQNTLKNEQPNSKTQNRVILNIDLMFPFKAMNIQYVQHCLCYWQLRIKRVKPAHWMCFHSICLTSFAGELN